MEGSTVGVVCVNEKVATAILLNETITLFSAEPFDLTVWHCHSPVVISSVILAFHLLICRIGSAEETKALSDNQFFERILAARLDKKVCKSKALLRAAVTARLTGMHGRARAFEVGRRHYDIGNDLFTVMLDKRMNYSCGYWQEADTLDKAQEAKLELTCRKLGLEPGMRVLDIGCGWGGFAIYAAEKYRVEVTGVTVSGAQVKLAQSCCAYLPVCFELKDYRDIQGTFVNLPVATRNRSPLTPSPRPASTKNSNLATPSRTNKSN